MLYIGAKIIEAEPQDKNGQPGYRVLYGDKYVSWSPKTVFEEAYRPVSDGERALLDTAKRSQKPETFYDRLLAESRDLETKIEKLENWIGTTAFLALPAEQQGLLEDQRATMKIYAEILGRRIAALQSSGHGQAEEVQEIDEGVRFTGRNRSEEALPFRDGDEKRASAAGRRLASGAGTI